MDSNLETVLQLDAHCYEWVISIMIFTKRNSCMCTTGDTEKNQGNIICHRKINLIVHQ